ncbi:MAG: peroxiredoxin [Rhodocyclaceae bacterium]|uniref:thioredoxin-dependent peroxiredoxin n=1 Tax=Candidatus Desulfobacillus denitrificans TaxID=2608985 RepID=A0A809RMF4_9PROT|nr:peroxiredoxin [Candidatus Desulfobacillus denitrificans]GIK44270.1 MAG: peroxiredoxin [Betaproteobacteria bacterium]GJQ55237.1 MAG: peroxiredoxin [Rhodocyclaceae bacterium]
MKPKPGDPAPDFSCHATDGSVIRLADFRGRKLVLYFYPMDDTPGCTAQACSLRDANRDIAARGAAILGVSAQGDESHRKFTSKYKLNFPLLADTDRAMAKAYGVAGSGLFGVARALAGMHERVTFIIDGKGKIAHVLDDPDCANHGEEVLKFL